MWFICIFVYIYIYIYIVWLTTTWKPDKMMMMIVMLFYFHLHSHFTFTCACAFTFAFIFTCTFSFSFTMTLLFSYSCSFHSHLHVRCTFTCTSYMLSKTLSMRNIIKRHQCKRVDARDRFLIWLKPPIIQTSIFAHLDHFGNLLLAFWWQILCCSQCFDIKPSLILMDAPISQRVAAQSAEIALAKSGRWKRHMQINPCLSSGIGESSWRK